MVVRRFVSLLLLAVGFALALGPAASADEYKNVSRHFTFQFPNSWTPIIKDVMSKANTMANQAAPGMNINYVAGFQRVGQPPMSYPYVLVQPVSVPFNTSSYEDIEKALAKEFKTEVKEAVQNAKDAFPGLIQSASLGTPVLDKANNRVIVRLEMTGPPGIGKIKGLSIGQLGSQEIVFLHCYAKDAEFDKYLPVFQSMADSFKFDPGYEFKPGQSSPSFLGNVGNGAVRGAVIGGIIGALVGVPLWYLQKRKKTHQSSPGNFAPVQPPPAVSPDTGITTRGPGAQ
jgi:hypothetical protein